MLVFAALRCANFCAGVVQIVICKLQVDMTLGNCTHTMQHQTSPCKIWNDIVCGFEIGQEKETLQLRNGWSLWLIYLVITNQACWGPSGHSTASRDKNGSFPMAASQLLLGRQECTTVVQSSFTFSPKAPGQKDLLPPAGTMFVISPQRRRSAETCRTTH